MSTLTDRLRLEWFLVYLGAAYSMGAMDALDALGDGSVTMHPLGGEATFTSAWRALGS